MLLERIYGAAEIASPGNCQTIAQKENAVANVELSVTSAAKVAKMQLAVERQGDAIGIALERGEEAISKPSTAGKMDYV